MRKVFERRSFHADFLRQEKRGKDFSKLDLVVTKLAETGRVAASRRPHKLSGDYEGLWECHIESDWLLIYDISDRELMLARTGSHDDLFGE
ncbi:MAG TPA: type II toxin-antitoxin system YafQ family toxin [Candidatus Paceibacterota bacterium]